MKKFEIGKDIEGVDLYRYMIEAVSPRPIAFASTVDVDGVPNLAPFSFFNMFSSKPPTLVISPNRRAKDNTTKDTLDNLHQVKEVVINVVNYSIVQQMSLTSADFDSDVNEFTKSGLTPLASEMVKPARVKESPVQFECNVTEIIELGKHGGAGNLVICEILLMHIKEEILNTQGRIDPNKIKLVGRMGGATYNKAFGDALFEVSRPNPHCIGFDNLPEKVRNSVILTGNDLAKLANVTNLPSSAEVEAMKEGLKEVFASFVDDDATLYHKNVQEYAKDLIEQGDIETAWKVLLTD